MMKNAIIEWKNYERSGKVMSCLILKLIYCQYDLMWYWRGSGREELDDVVIETIRSRFFASLEGTLIFDCFLNFNLTHLERTLKRETEGKRNTDWKVIISK